MAFEYPKLHLYRMSGSCSLVPHMLLRHLDIPFDHTALEYGGGGAAVDGSFDAATYKRNVNATGQVPSLAVGGGAADNKPGDGIVTQNAAVVGYIAELAQQAGHPDAAGLLGGSGPGALLARARVQQWVAYATSFVHAQGFATGYAPATFTEGGDETICASVAAKGRQKIATAFARYEAELGGDGASRFAVGSGLTLVDFFVYLFWRWSRYPIFLEALPGPYSHLEAVARNVEKLPGVRKALEVEGLERVFGGE